MKRIILRATAIFLGAVIFASVCGCKAKDEKPKLDMNFTQKESNIIFESQNSPLIKLSAQKAQAVSDMIDSKSVLYEYSHFYELDEVKKRLSFDASVKTHKSPALNSEEKLDARILAEKVRDNNAEYLKVHKSGYEEPDEGYIFDLCEVIVKTVESVLNDTPEIDRPRVYCNLGNLKILYDVGMLDFAQVSKEMVLSVNEQSTKIATTLKGEYAFRNILIHEIMHIIQIGCRCEQIENCSRRCGISVFYEDFPINTADWGWFFEASAERNMCRFTGEKPVTYQTLLRFLRSFTLSAMPKSSVQADTVEKISFLSDPQILFDTFGAVSEPMREELIKLMISVNALSVAPDAFFEALEAKMGNDIRENEEQKALFDNSLKTSVYLTMSKIFFKGLAQQISEKQMSLSDIFFLINLFEADISRSLKYQNEDGAQSVFISEYNTIRDMLFKAISDENQDIKPEALYPEYSITDNEKKICNAGLQVFAEEKREYFAECFEELAEYDHITAKVPFA